MGGEVGPLFVTQNEGGNYARTVYTQNAINSPKKEEEKKKAEEEAFSSCNRTKKKKRLPPSLLTFL